MVHAARKKRNRAIGRKKKVVFSSTVPFPNYETNSPMSDVPSLNKRILGPIPKRKTYTSNHTIAPAYNKGGYQVISKECIKDIGK
jgi:hypothetical protein